MREFKNANQLKSFIKKEAERLNISVGNAYSTYISRCILERLSKQGNPNVLIKGSAAEYTYLGRLVRAIVDLDIASLTDFDSSLQTIIGTFQQEGNDVFDIKLAKPVDQTRTGIYKFGTQAEFDRMRIPLGMDFQENYNRLIEKEVRLVTPLFEGDEPFEVIVPSFEEYLAEKLCIVVETNKEDVLNTRVKDFYDIYELHGGRYDFDKLSEYFAKMLKLRNKIQIEDASTVRLNRKFIDDHEPIWESTKMKYDFIDSDIDFSGAVYYTRAVLREQLQKNGIDMPNFINTEVKRYVYKK